MGNFIVLSAMKGRFISEQGNTYDNFQMMGYVQAASASEAVTTFFDQSPYPIIWADVEYMWAQELVDTPDNRPHGDYDRVYLEDLRARWDKNPDG